MKNQILFPATSPELPTPPPPGAVAIRFDPAERTFEFLDASGNVVELIPADAQGKIPIARLPATIPAENLPVIPAEKLPALSTPYDGEPVNAVAATASLGDDPPADGVVITAPVKGAAANAYTVVVEQAADADEEVSTAAAFAEGVLTITLGTDANGDPDATKATPTIVAAAIEAGTDFTATAAGETAITTTGETPAAFSGGIDGTPANLGRTATDGADVWRALRQDSTETQDSWVKEGEEFDENGRLKAEKLPAGIIAAPVTVADAAARKSAESYASAVVGQLRVIQANLPGIIWNLVAADVTLDASWIGLPFTVDPDGDVVVSMELADVGGTVPDKNVLGVAGGFLRIGDGFTECGRRIARAPGIELFQHTLDYTLWRKAAKFVSTKDTAISATVKTTTGYCKILNFDGTYEAVDGAGTPGSNITVASKTPVSPWNTKIPKFYAILPCDAGGTVTGDLTYLSIPTNQLTSFDGTGLSALTYLSLASNQLTSFDGTGLSALIFLSLSTNQLTSFDATGFPGLMTLSLSSNQLTSFVAAFLPALSTLELSNNQLTSFDADTPALNYLTIYNNQLTSFDGTGLPALKRLEIYGNQLTSFTAEGLSLLEYLNIKNNLLTELNMAGLTPLGYFGTGVDLQSNLLSGPALDAFYTSLGAAGTSSINVTGNTGTSSDDPTIATAKGYTVVGS